MRRILIFCLIIIFVIFFGVAVANGVNVGNLHISSVQEIIDANDELENEIEVLQDSIDTDYTEANSEVESSYKKLLTAKQNYQSAIAYSTEEEIQEANQTEEYQIGYLWTKIGLYATNNNVTMKAELTNGTNGVTGQYDIAFTVVGEYLSISEFIYAIENDSDLGFKIEDFTLVDYGSGKEGEEDWLQGTFYIKNIPIDSNSITETTDETSSEDTDENVETSSEETSEY